MALVVGTSMSIFSMFSAPVSPEQALRRLSSSSMKAPSSISHRPSQPKFSARIATPKGSEAIYIFNYEQAPGYLILPADDRFSPVLGYSESGNISLNEIPDGLTWWLKMMADEIGAVVDASSDSEDVPDVYLPPSLGDPVEPIITTSWGQTFPYNNKTPIISEKQSPTGCVATALTQVMYHYKWPVNPTGSITYEDTSKPKNTYSMNFDGLTFDWGAMTRDYDEESSEEAQDAVSLLMKAVGYGVQMTYGASSSGATDANALNAMTSYFGYSSSARMIRRESLLRTEWDEMLYRLLKSGNPIYYTGRDAVWLGSGGHAFICDGYDGEGYFHFNWGWNGSYNGWFLTSCLVPAGAGTGGFINGYNYTQSIMVNLHPDDGQEYDQYSYVIASNVAYNQNTREIKASLKDGGISTEYSIGVAVNVNGENPDGEKIYLKLEGTPQAGSWVLPESFLNELEKDLLYDLRLVWKNENDSEWKRVFPETSGLLAYSPEPAGGILAYGNDGWNLTLKNVDFNPMDLSIRGLRVNGSHYMVSGMTNSLDMTLVNNSNDYQYHAGRCYAIDKATGKETQLFNASLEVGPSEESEKSYTMKATTTLPVGEYSLRFINVNYNQEIPFEDDFTLKVFDISDTKTYDDGVFKYSVLPGYFAAISELSAGNKLGGDVRIPKEVEIEGTVYPLDRMDIKLNSIVDKSTITSLDIEFPITVIPEYHITSCEQLTTLKLPVSLKEICTSGFSLNKALKEIEFRGTPEKLGKRSFYFCNSLEKINIPAVDSIPEECFYGAYAMKEIVIPEGVKFIGSKAFYNWEVMNYLELPSTLQEIDASAFAGYKGNSSSITVKCHAVNPPGAQSNSFNSNLIKNGTLMVPGGTKAAYAAHPVWGTFANIEEFDSTVGVGEIHLDENCEWYTLDGKKLFGAPSEPGLYVKKNSVGKSKIVILN